MLISAIKLQNFGIYNGCHNLDLTPKTQKKSVLLIGGKNGAGKSTLFEAIKLCLYGSKSLNERISTSEYLSYLKSRINWFTKKDEMTFVQLKFKAFREGDHPTKSREYEYNIVRKWYLSGHSIKEDLSIEQDGQLLNLDPSFWQDFIEDLIPQGVIDLFFFDGEKIQTLAEGSNQNLAYSVKSLLNLSIIPSLSTDLQMIYKKHIETSKGVLTSKELKNISNKISVLKKEFDKCQSSHASSNSKVSSTKSYIKRLEEKLKKEGGEYYEKRDKLKEYQKEDNIKIDQTRQAVAYKCESHIPFMLAPSLIKKVSLQLKKEIQALEIKISNDVLAKKRIELDKTVKRIAKELKIKHNIAQSLSDQLSGYTSTWLSDFSKEDIKYELDVRSAYQCLDLLNNTKEEKNELVELFKELEKLSRHIKKVESQIERTLESDTVIQLHKEISTQNQILGSQEKEVQLYDKELGKNKRELELLSKRQKKLHDDLEKNKEQKDCYARIDNIKKVLFQFEKELTQQKLKQLEGAIYDCYSQVHGKSGFIKSVKIDPSCFEVTMLDKNQKVIPVDMLSAGEKQIYAISVLWALAKTSGKALPMIIDTPLGRLDAHHRDQLIKNFFPKASHQVVILSTDTEIHKSYFDKMQKHISHSYSINFNLQKGYSNIHKGYLFPDQISMDGMQ